MQQGANDMVSSIVLKVNKNNIYHWFWLQYITVPLVVQPTEMKEMEAVDAMLQTFVCLFFCKIWKSDQLVSSLYATGGMTWCQV